MKRFDAAAHNSLLCPPGVLTGLLLTAFLVGLIGAVAGEAQAQQYAAFAHGITFGDDRPEANDQTLQEAIAAKASRWDASGTPQAWKEAGVIDGYTFLRYFDRDLYGGSRDKSWDSSREAMMERFVSDMKAAAPPEARWVLVGHSQGGIVVRLLHEYIRQNHPEIDLQGVMAVASPLQGARAVEMAYNDFDGYYNVQPKIMGTLEDILRGPAGDAFEDAILRLGYQPYGGSQFIELGSNFIDLYGMSGASIAHALDPFLASAVNAISYDKKAASAIGPGGELISQINGAPRPDQYRSLIGAERFPVPFRVWSAQPTAGQEDAEPTFPWLPLFGLGGGAFVEEKGFPSVGVLLKSLGSLPSFGPGEEPETVRYFRTVHLLYEMQEDLYNQQQHWYFAYYSCWDGKGYNPCVREDRWDDGEDAIQNFPKTFAEIIDANRLVRRTDTFEETVCPNIGSGSQRVARARFTPPSAKAWVERDLELPDDDGGGRDGQRDDDGAEGNECWTETVTEDYYLSVSDKHDGIVGVETGVWSEGDRPDDESNNFLFDDEGGSAEDTGFNHGEMVYNRRRFDSSADPYPYDVSFQRGDLNPPMVNAQDWIAEEVLGGVE